MADNYFQTLNTPPQETCNVLPGMNTGVWLRKKFGYSHQLGWPASDWTFRRKPFLPLSWSGKDWNYALDIRALSWSVQIFGCCHRLFFIGLLFVYFVFHFCGGLYGFFFFLLLYVLFVYQRERESEHKVGWVERWERSGMNWGRRKHDQNIVWKKLFQLKTPNFLKNRTLKT